MDVNSEPETVVPASDFAPGCERGAGERFHPWPVNQRESTAAVKKSGKGDIRAGFKQSFTGDGRSATKFKVMVPKGKPKPHLWITMLIPKAYGADAFDSSLGNFCEEA